MPASASESPVAVAPHIVQPKAHVPSPHHYTLAQDIVHLVGCTAAIYICYLVYGIYQEQIYVTKRGPNQDKFTFSLFLVCAQSIANALLAQFCLLLIRPKPAGVPPLKYIYISTSYIGAMFSSNAALRYVDYPTQVLGKSCKMIPVMLTGVLFHGKKYKWRQYVAVFAITAGMTIFALFGGKAKKGGDLQLIGVVFLSISLFLDGFTGPMQESVIENHKPTVHQLMLGTNLAAILWSFIGLIATQTLVPAIQFLITYPDVLVDIAKYCVLSALGQMFIFVSMNRFGALVVTIITTTRKFFTILASVFYFHHEVKTLQWLGVVLVFIGLGIEIHFKYENKMKAQKSLKAQKLE